MVTHLSGTSQGRVRNIPTCGQGYPDVWAPDVLGISGPRTFKDAAFLLAVGSFLLTVELLCLQLCFGAFRLTIGAFLLTI